MAEQVFELIEPFAGYAFNKAHSVSYAMIAYQTAYLKANYPVEYMTALLLSHSGQQDKVATAVADCQRMDIKVLPPDVNRSEASFSIEDSAEPAIRFGLSDIKNVGAGAIAPIVEARKKGGPFKSIEDFCRRADLRGMNKKVMESLIKAGALDCLAGRGALLNQIDRIMSLSQREQSLRESGQATMFDLWGATTPTPLPEMTMEDVEVSYQRQAGLGKGLDRGLSLRPPVLPGSARAQVQHYRLLRRDQCRNGGPDGDRGRPGGLCQAGPDQEPAALRQRHPGGPGRQRRGDLLVPGLPAERRSSGSRATYC